MGKQNLYDHSVRVPVIISGKGIPAGTRADALTYSFDLFPTLCDLIGIPVPETVESQSLVPLITGERERSRSTVFSLYKDIQRMVSDGEWKLIRYYRSERKEAGEDRIQLFHLKEDPAEMRNLAGDPVYAGKLEQLAEALTDWQREVNDPWAGRPVLLAEGAGQ